MTSNLPPTPDNLGAIARFRRWLTKPNTLISAGGLAVVGAALYLGGQYLAYQKTSPFLESELSRALGRPVKIGPVEEINLLGVRLGPSYLPPTSDDATAIAMDSIEMGMNLLPIFMGRPVEIWATLVNPNITLKQQDTGQWTTLISETAQGQERLELPLDVNATVNLENAKLSVLPQQFSQPLKIEVEGNTDYQYRRRDNQQTAGYDLGVQLGGSSLQAQGTTDINAGNNDVNLTINRLDLPTLVGLLPPLPLQIKSGELSGEIQANLPGWQQFEALQAMGDVKLNQLQARIDNVKAPLKVSLDMALAGQTLQINQGQINLGSLNASLQGNIDQQSGYDLKFATNAVDTKAFFETIAVPLPLPFQGKVQAQGQFLGPLDNPRLQGKLTNGSRVKVDQVLLEKLAVDFRANLDQIALPNIKMQPVSGGQISAQVQSPWKLRQLFTPEAEQWQWQTIPVQGKFSGAIATMALLKTYKVDLSQVEIGNADFTGQVGGTLAKPRLNLEWQTIAGNTPNRLNVRSQGQAELFGAQLTLTKGELTTGAGFLNVQGQANFAEDSWQAQGQTSQFPLQPFLQSLCNLEQANLCLPQLASKPITITTGQGNVQGKISAFDVNNWQGNAQVQLASNGERAAVDANLQQGQINAQVNAQNIAVNPYLAQLNTPVQVQQLTAQGQFPLAPFLTGQLPLGEITGQTQLTALVDNRLVTADAQLSQGNVQTNTSLGAIALNPFLPNLPVIANLNSGQLQGTGFVGDVTTWEGLQNLDLNRFQGEGQFSLTVADGPVDLTGNLINGNLSAIARVGEIPLNASIPQLPLPAAVQGGNISLTANLADLLQGEPDLSKVTANANLDLKVAGGTVTTVSNLRNLAWQSQLEAQDLNLNPLLAKYEQTNQFSLEPVQGQMNLAGNLAGLFKPNQPSLNIPVTVQKANLTSGDQTITAQGNLTLGNLSQRPQLTTVNLNVSNGLNLAQLPVNSLLTQLPLAPEFRPATVDLVGTSQFTGQLTGKNVTDIGGLKLAGNLQVNNLAVNDYDFETQLQGPFSLQGDQKLQVDLQGEKDRLAVNLKPCLGDCLFPYFPTSFNLRQAHNREQPIVAQGKLSGNNLAMTVEHFPLALLDLRPGRRYQIPGQLDGDFNASLVVNLRNGHGQGDLDIAMVKLGETAIGDVSAQLAYQNQILQLKRGEIATNTGKYQAQGSLNFETQAIQARATVDDAQIMPLLAALQISDIDSLLRLGRLQGIPGDQAGDIGGLSVGNPDVALENQLNLLYVIDQQIIALAREYERGGVPTELNLRGHFDAAIDLGGTLRDPSLGVKIEGKNLSWYPQRAFANIMPPIGLVINETRFLPIQRFQLEAKFADGQIALLPSFLEIRESRLGAEGIFSLEKSQLAWSIDDFNLSNFDAFVEVPQASNARLNAQGLVELSPSGPTLSGQFNLDEITLNARLVPESVGGSFNYQNNLLQLMTSDVSPVYVRADVPFYWNPWEAKIAEGPNTFRVDLKVPSDSLKLLEVVTQEQLVWLGGEGEVDLKVEGEIDQQNGIGIKDLRALGNVTLTGAKFRSAALPTTVEVDGEILFNNTAIAIEQLTGQLDNSRIDIAGILPLFDAQPGLENPLQVSIKPTNISIPNLYQGNLEGLIKVEGSILKPEITGDVALANGRVLVPVQDETAEQPSRIAEIRTRLGWFRGERPVPFIEPKVNDLRITLKNLHVEQNPLYAFSFGGDLTVNGSLSDFENLRADGAINLNRGRVSFFDTRFLIDRRSPNTITFSSDRDLLNPDLNIAMRTIVSDLPQSARMRSQETNEYPDDSLNQIQRIDVRLTIDGSLSQILPNLNPRYSAVCDPTVTFRPLTGVGSFDEFQLERLSNCLQILAAKGDENGQIFSNPALNLSSSPPRTEGEIVRLLGEQVIVLVDALQGKNSSQLLQVGITQLAIPMIFQGLVYDVESAIGDKIKSTDFRVVPFLEAIYQVEDKGYVRLTYDYNVSQFIIRYEKQF